MAVGRSKPVPAANRQVPGEAASVSRHCGQRQYSNCRAVPLMISPRMEFIDHTLKSKRVEKSRTIQSERRPHFCKR